MPITLNTETKSSLKRVCDEAGKSLGRTDLYAKALQGIDFVASNNKIQTGGLEAGLRKIVEIAKADKSDATLIEALIGQFKKR